MRILIFEPLEQFNLIYFTCCKLKFITFLLNNFSITIIFILILLYFVLWNVQNLSLVNWYIIPLKTTFLFLQNICKSNLNVSVNIFVPILFFYFFFIFFSNISGMIPYSITITSHFSTTFFLALSFFIGLNIIGILYNGILFFNIFLPASAPVVISPLLFIVEVVSYIARVFSLAIRLFANMLAGHALLKILAGFAWNFLLLFTFLGFFCFLIIFCIIFCIVGLEFLISFLQAYVFFILCTVYINDVISIH